MIFEYFFDAKTLNKEPHIFIMLGFLYSSVAMTVSYITFREHSALLMVFLTVLALAPIIYQSIKHEEYEDLVLEDEKAILKEHSKTLKKFMYIFFGMVISFSLWYSVLPGGSVEQMFGAQLDTINRINEHVSIEGISGNVVMERFPVMMTILMNNIGVLIASIIFSLLFGFGAIFILSWNASVIGAAMGNIIREGIAEASSLSGIIRPITYFNVVSYSIMRYAIHGIPEILAYFVGGLAGGIMFFAIIKHDTKSKKFNKILRDSFDLVFIAIGLLVLAAFLEVYVTPALF